MKEIFLPEKYKMFIKNYLYVDEISFGEQIFSLKNERQRRSKVKVLRLLGKRFVLKRSPR